MVRGLVDLGGYRVFLDCVGDGSPTVVLESGAVTPAASWSAVQKMVANTVQVCTYDRPGSGQSEARDSGTVTVAQVAADLHALLTTAGLRGPYVLVGQSLGGWIVRVLAGAHADEVVGLVLVDATPEDYPLRPVDTFLGYGGFIDQAQSAEQVRAAGGLRDLPLIVLAGASGPFGNSAQQQALAMLSSRGTMRLVERSGHHIERDRPDAVADAILEVIEATRRP